jgi:flagellar motility protein MotE (MotC chaperone)
LASTSSTSNPTQQKSAGDKLKKLVKVYENMDSEQAANIIDKLSNSEATALLSAMSAEQAAEILGAMNTSRAAILSEKLGLQQE